MLPYIAYMDPMGNSSSEGQNWVPFWDPPSCGIMMAAPLKNPH